jgi:hypothetical protein
MNVMTLLPFRFTDYKNVMVSLFLGSIGYFFYDKYKSNQVRNHPSFEMAQMVLKQDKRVSNFCGRNYNRLRESNYWLVCIFCWPWSFNSNAVPNPCLVCKRRF